MARQRNVFAAFKYLYSRFSGQMPIVPEYSFDNNKQLQVRNAANTADVPLIGNDASDITQLGNPNGVNALAFTTTQLATPGTPTVAVLGTAGSTTWAYKIVAKAGNGSVLGVTAASAAGQTTTGNATLSSANFNTITWAAVPGAVSYDIYRTTAAGTPSSTGLIGNLAAQIISETTIAPTFNDTGLTGDTTTAPTVNTTGAVSFAGPVSFSSGGAFLDASSLTAITTAGAGTYTAAALVGSGSGLNIITRNCNGASRTDTTGTAAAIVAALGGAGVVAVGTSFQFLVKNISTAGQTITVAGGSGVTFPNDAQLTIVSGASQLFVGRVTNAGTPAVSLYLDDTYGTAITDTSGNQVIALNPAASAVNWLVVSNRGTGAAPVISVDGEAGVGLQLTTKSTSAMSFQTNGNALGGTNQFQVQDAASAINYLAVKGAATTAPPVIGIGSTTDANVGVTVVPKGIGALNVTQSTNTGPGLSVVGVASAVNGLLVTPAATAGTPVLSSAVSGADANSPIALTSNGTGTVDLATGNNARVQFRVKDTAGTIINRLTVTGNVTTSAPVIGIDTTTDSNVSVIVTPKGTGGLCSGAAPGQFGALSHIMSDFAIATSNTALTAAQMIDGIIRVTAGTNTNATDSAANIVAAIPNCQVGSTFEMMVINGSGQVETLTLGSGVTAASGVTVTLTTATATCKRYLFRVTNVGTPAVTIYETSASTL